MNGEDIRALQGFRSPIRRELDRLEERLSCLIDSDTPMIGRICEQIAASPGKRIRPAMLFLAAKSDGGASEHAVDAGAAIELVHTASLLHDDVLDDHETRRGSLTVYASWGPKLSTLMGDLLYSKAFSLLAEMGRHELLGILSAVTHEMSVGEIVQYQLRHDITVNEERYMELIFRKTASLFSAACECGAVLSGSCNGSRKSLSGFGNRLGLAFQITDDLFDYLAVDEGIGKPTASDFGDGRVTLPLLTSLGNAPAAARERVGGLFRCGFDRGKHWDEVVSFVREYGGIEYAIGRARDLGKEAKAFLLDLTPSPSRDALGMAADYVVGRVEPYCR
ncbi:MAG: polyprenyl synthetase family protein [Candidatus Krumholzibacteriota bacterium]|nr:polyprenyl synthetase family protein [Candidatus Krumholzibacteriota bacterium]